MATETIWEPLIISASFAPNPATSGKAVLLSVVVVDVFGKEQEELRGSGEFGSGEV